MISMNEAVSELLAELRGARSPAALSPTRSIPHGGPFEYRCQRCRRLISSDVTSSSGAILVTREDMWTAAHKAGRDSPIDRARTPVPAPARWRVLHHRCAPPVLDDFYYLPVGHIRTRRQVEDHMERLATKTWADLTQPLDQLVAPPGRTPDRRGRWIVH